MAKQQLNFATPIIQAAASVAKAVSARAVFVYYAALDDAGKLKSLVKSPTELILICRDDEEVEAASKVSSNTMKVPAFSLTRMGQIKMASLIAFSQGMLQGGDSFVFLAGLADQGIDTLVTMKVGEEYELFQSVGQPKLTEHIKRAVFERVLTLCLELAHEGREGKPVGSIFVLGDYREVGKYCQEGRINPFKGYTEKERNIMDDSIRETVKELSKLDGAFVLKGTGVIMSAATMLQAGTSSEESTRGLGARHSAAAAITSVTRSIAISISESTGTVRIWRRGQMITEIERSPRSA